jgi:hypothetical protein
VSYSSLYRKRMGIRGRTQAERNFRMAERSFRQWFENALSKEKVVIDGVEQYAVFQDQSQSNNKDLSDDKYMIVENSSNAKVGSYVEWRGQIGIVFTGEEKTIPTHKQFKTKVANHVIKWMIGDKISGNGNGYPAYVQNQTLYTLGVSTSGHHAWIVNAKMMMYLQDNEETRQIKIGQRIFIGNQVYQVMFADPVSRRGLINYLLEQDFPNPEKDNFELGVADYYTALEKESSNDTEQPTGTSKEVVINGSEKARIGSTHKYEASVFSNRAKLSEGITEWAIADTEAVATVVEQTTEYIKIYFESNFKKVGSTITIIGKSEDGVIGSKTVRIISPY